MVRNFKFLFYLVGITFLLTSCFEKKQSEEKKEQTTSTFVSKTPNIVLVKVDDFTQDFLGLRSTNISATPFLDSISKGSTFFENAMVQGVMCTPSRNSFITANYPHELNLYHNLDLKNLPDSIWTFPKALQKSGYKTLWVGKNHILTLESNRPTHSPAVYRNNGLCAMGFDYVYESMGRSIVTQMVRQQYNNGAAWKDGKDTYGDFIDRNNLMEKFCEESDRKLTTLDPDTEYMDGHFTHEAIKVLEQNIDDKPFFLWLNFSGPHHPFDAPFTFHKKFNKVITKNPISEDEHNYELPKSWKKNNQKKTLQQHKTSRRRYLGNIAYMDNQIERLYEYLTISNQIDNTYFIFVSDHGITTGDHGLTGKQNLFNQVLKSSLIIKKPRQKEGKVVFQPVELIDLPKTLLDIANQGNSTSKKVLETVPNGKSLLPYLDNKENTIADNLAVSQMRDYMSIVDGNYKLIIGKDTKLLFNMANDPYEINNTIENEIEKKDEMIDKLLTLRPKFTSYVNRISN
ncbi:sulfatase family protein [Patiriisocius hiemis]|uniref:Sulfatase-like hydrolase/transferase n=1 Tax=Patiriisocius hiemis TaxID=3075604 RepID=A0ABU2YCA5_9FLAO|nr:sulfatase-like hydrolase/transferase [Constantimarinum sp. W242]MDT0555818.1 sulfatase-like hydrolase/transferase [Constantimarinum sp. W242]